MSINKEDIKSFFDAFGASLDASRNEAFDEIADNELFVKATECAKRGDYEMFDMQLLHPYREVVSALLSRVTSSSEAQFLIENGEFVDRFFEKMFTRFEGMPCCADKSRTIIKALIRFYTTGKRIGFNYDGEYTYHLPTKIFKDHDQIVEYFRGIWGLYYGNHDNYIMAVGEVFKTAKAA